MESKIMFLARPEGGSRIVILHMINSKIEGISRNG
jgi:hypothetical protein